MRIVRSIVSIVLFLSVSTAVGLVFFGGDTYASSVDNFKINSFDVDMQLSRDEENRSTLEVTETVTADFPPNQNRGLVRNFVKDYDGHSTSFKLESVQDENGGELNYNWQDNTLRIGDEDVFVEGKKTYAIKYTQRDVTRYYQDTNKDEFYWDVLGVEWRVPIENLNISLKINRELIGLLDPSPKCYTGQDKASSLCSLSTAGEGEYKMSASNLSPGHGVTVAFGFKPNTFAAYEQSLVEKILGWLLSAVITSSLVLGPIGTLLAYFWYSRKRRKILDTPDRLAVKNRAIVPEYIPPAGHSVLDGSFVLLGNFYNKSLPAQIIDWAVRHYISIEQIGEKTIFSKSNYRFTILRSFDDLSNDEIELAKALFGGTLETGTRITMEEIRKNDQAIGRAMTAITARLEKDSAGFKENPPELTKLKSSLTKFMVTAGFVLLNPVLWVANLLITVIWSDKVPTVKAETLKKYLFGLKMYIGVAEKERLAMLQSPEGAAKVGSIDGVGGRIKLYEKALPYAILFGQEKRWAKELGDLYQTNGVQPDWMVGSFAAASFADSIGDIGTGVLAASSSYSSSGGSSGGGYSGGGGGGGGGGGW